MLQRVEIEPRCWRANESRRFRSALKVVTLLLTFSFVFPSAAYSAVQPTFATRLEAKFGTSPFYFSTGEWRAMAGPQWTNLRSGERQIAANFLVEDAGVPVTILFAAEAYVDTKGESLFLRLLVDGEPMKPGDVVLARGGGSDLRAARTFEFTGLYDEGIHTVEAQWKVDQGGATGYVRQVGLFVRQGDVDDANNERRALLGVTPDSGRNIETKSVLWQDVPGLEGTINTEERDCLTATVSAEAYERAGKSLRLRFLIDGSLAAPGSVEFVRGGYEGTRSMVFGSCDLPPGGHDVRAQWRTDAGGLAGLGDRTLTLSVIGNSNNDALRQYFASENDTVDAPVQYTQMPGMSHTVLVQPNSEISVLLSVEFPSVALDDVYARLVVHGTPVPDSEVLLTNKHAKPGAHAFVFNAKHVHAGGSTESGPIEIEWKSARVKGTKIRARSMATYVQPQAVPDLADPPPFGGVVGGVSVEPMRGPHKLLVILWDPGRPGHPAPSVDEIEDAFFGAANSVADYYDTISGGRFTLEQTEVLGPYASDFDWDHYANGPGDHQDKWVEALDKADAYFDFSLYDLDGDGYVHPWHELGIVIVVPQTGSDGFVRHLWESDPGDVPKQFDNVDIELITEWYTSNPEVNYMTAAHELGHQILFLSDLYGKVSVGPQLGTRPGRLSSMDATPSSLTAHLDAGLKLALGWVTPRIVTESGTYSLQDVKVSAEVLVLPRLPGSSGAEYLVVENRQSAAINTLYDMGLSDSGIAVWHLIEGSTDNDTPPNCTNNALWDNQAGSDDPRQGIRLLRPSIAYSDVDALWSAEHYDLDGLGLTCPSAGDAHNVLRWADGTASYSLFDFPVSAPIMTFDVVAP